MNAKEIKDLIHKFQAGTITDLEREKLESLWQKYAEDDTFLNLLSEAKQDQLKVEIFDGVKERILNKFSGPGESIKRLNPLSFIYKVAASFIVIVIASAFFYNYSIKESSVTYRTEYGQVKRVVLPDNSVVMLNGNSSIKYLKSINNDTKREVWLQGEAFFTVTHTKSHQKFIVNTSKKVDIEVLGTEFNVTDRRDELRVVLTSGKVKLNIDKAKPTEVFMTPGNMIEFKGTNENYVKKDVNPKVYSSWTTERMIFDNETLEEISAALMETYGVKLEFSNQTLLKESFSASFPKNDINVLIIAMAKSFDLRVVKKGNTIKMFKKG